MKKTLLIGVALACTSTCMAADMLPLTIELTDGTSKTLQSENLTMAFQEGSLVATNNDGVFQTPTSRITRFYFAGGSDGVDGVETATLSNVDVFSATGVFMGNFESADEAGKALTPGLYIMRAGNKSFKTVVR